MKNLTQKDIQQLKSHGLSPEKVEQQLETFKTGIPFVKLVAPATLEGGIRKLSKTEIKKYAEKYDAQNMDIVKFVPASGAATRMFKDLQGFQNLVGLHDRTWKWGKKATSRLGDLARERQGEAVKGLQGDELFEKELNKPEHKPVREFFKTLPDFAFYELLRSETQKHYPDFDDFSETEKNYILLKTLLDKDKLNFSNLPKGLVPFHKYANETRTAFEEHFFEANALGSNVKLHFTIAEKHLEKFKREYKKITNFSPLEGDAEGRGGLIPSHFGEVGWGFQEKSTDTIAVDMENKPFRDENGKLVFRPAGHGALLENLNTIDADIIFIKNIDNVSTEKNLSAIAEHKKALAGILLELQTGVFGLLKNLQGSVSDKTREEAHIFLKEKLNISNPPENITHIKTLFDRPIRVCGMVKNTGAPGGGPFWVQEEDGKISLQIVETAQIDLENPQQKEIFENATHFNPVDLVCGVKNYKGKKFDLMEFSNSKRGFITLKSMNGKSLKALELPGLWNGAMEHWNTVFVEVPLETFNPVKTVMDLLKPGHQ